MDKKCEKCGKELEFLEERIFETFDGEKKSLCLKCHEKETSKKKLEKIHEMGITKEELHIAMWNAQKKIIAGCFWFILGSVMTWVSLNSYSSPYGYVLFGAIIFGLYDILIGLSRYTSAKETYKKLEEGVLTETNI